MPGRIGRRPAFFRVDFMLAVVVVTVLHAEGQPAPTNDMFASATLISGTNVVITGSNINATKEPGEPNHAGNPGGKSVWWSWRAPHDGYVTVSTEGSTSIYGGPLDTLLGIYTGSTVSNLTTIATNDDGPIDVTSLATFHASAGVVYDIAVDGFTYDIPQDADSGSIQLSVTFSGGLPLAPPWDLPSTGGTNLSSTNFLGKVVVLNFWATWCIPCQGETPDLVALQQKYAPDGLMVVGVSVDDSPDGSNPPTATVSSYAATNGVSYPLVMTRPLHLAVESAYGGIPYTPQTFILDRQNHIAQTFVEEEDFQIFQSAVLPLLYPNLAVKIAISGGQVRISWPLTQATFQLQSKASLASTNWTAVSATVQSDGTNNFVLVPIGPNASFFRIESQ